MEGVCGDVCESVDRGNVNRIVPPACGRERGDVYQMHFINVLAIRQRPVGCRLFSAKIFCDA
jgi:hypothetical protein